MVQFSLISICIGIILLLIGLKKTMEIRKVIPVSLQFKWNVIIILISFFIISYFFTSFVLFTTEFVNISLMALVYMFGSLFVTIILVLTGRTIHAMDENEHIKKLNIALKEKKDFLSNVIESLNHPFYVIDINDYSVKLANSAAKLGALSDASTCYQLTHHRDSPCESKDHICPLEQVKRTGKPSSVEHIHYDNDGVEHNVEVHAHPIFNESGELVEMIEYSLDITKRKKAELKTQQLNQELFKAKEELERLLDQKNEFIHILNHDLKNPLSAPMNLLPIIEKKIDDEKIKDMVQTVYHSLKLIKTIIYDTLKLARLDNLDNSVVIEEINLYELVEKVISENEEIINQYQFIVENNIEQDLMIHSDTFLLSQVFHNLISNAIKYTTESDEQQIIISSNLINDSVIVSVKDFGQGIKKDHMMDIFDEFTKQLKPREGFDSTGLGLAICKKIIRRLGGQIWAESDGVGKGSTFYVSIPCLYEDLYFKKEEIHDDVREKIDAILK